MRVSEQQLRHVIDHGYAVVPGFLTAGEVRAATKNLHQYVPTRDELDAAPKKFEALMSAGDFLQLEFPFVGDALNDVTLHPALLDLAGRLLGTPDVQLSRSAAWAKYAGYGDYEQPLHADFEGNTLVYPRDDGDYRQVNLILYYTDVTAELGPTCVVPREKAPQGPAALWPPFRPRAKYPRLYRHEKPVIVGAGGLLIFGMTTFHRASAITAERGFRFSHHLVYRAARHGFQGYQAWPSYGEQAELHRVLERATLRQRQALGFPAPGDPYWNADTLAGVAARYPGMDLSPYRKASLNGISP